MTHSQFGYVRRAANLLAGRIDHLVRTTRPHLGNTNAPRSTTTSPLTSVDAEHPHQLSGPRSTDSQALTERVCRDRSMVCCPAAGIFSPRSLNQTTVHCTRTYDRARRWSTCQTTGLRIVLAGLSLLNTSAVEATTPRPAVSLSTTSGAWSLTVVMAWSSPGPTSAQPMSSSGPTASNAAFP